MKTRWHSCNVLQVGPEARQLWQFDARNGGFVLNREQTSFAGEGLPGRIINKDWRALWQRKLNVAWLAPEHVFLRVVQLPASDFNETLSMVELQLEKLSPMPVTQVVWSIHVLSHAEGNMQTVIVMIVARDVVEEFLGRLEGEGYLADRLELPLLDQLQATPIDEEGAWIYPEGDTEGSRHMALVAWWYGGILRNLDLITMPTANPTEGLKEQLLQMAWAGEMEGWLTSTPRWHLVADAMIAPRWEPPLRDGLGQPITVLTPLPAPELAALTAQRAARAEPRATLLPAEFSTRYQQQFVDRLWMRALFSIALLYIIGVMIYGVALGVATYRTRAVEHKVRVLGPTYTNALELKAKLSVLNDRQELKYAALNIWDQIARLLPDSVMLEGLNFSNGKRLTLNGTAPSDKGTQVTDFYEALRKSSVDGQLLFDQRPGESLKIAPVPGGNLKWDFSLELLRKEIP